MWRGAAAIAMTQILGGSRLPGRAVGRALCGTSVYQRQHRTLQCGLCLKRPGDPLDVSDVLLPPCQAGSIAVLFFIAKSDWGPGTSHPRISVFPGRPR